MRIDIALGMGSDFDIVVIDEPPGPRCPRAPGSDGAPDRRAFMSGAFPHSTAGASTRGQLHFDFIVLTDDAQEEIKAWRRHRHRR